MTTTAEEAPAPAVLHLSAERARRARQGRARRGPPAEPCGVGRAARPPAIPSSVLEEQAAQRVPELVPIRYGRMLASPFAFFRGAAAIMAADLAATPRSGPPGPALRRRAPVELRRLRLARAGPRVRHQRLRRDAARAVGVGRQAARRQRRDRRARVAASSPASAGAAVVGDGAGLPGGDAQLRRGAQPRRLVLARWTPPRRSPTPCRTSARRSARSAERLIAKAQTKDSMKALSQADPVGDGEIRFVSDPPLIVPIAELVPGAVGRSRSAIRSAICCASTARALRPDRRRLLEGYRYVDLARKVVGVGSVGHAGVDRPAARSRRQGPADAPGQGGDGVGARGPTLGAATQPNHGQRVVEGQRLMQAASDILLGWLHTDRDRRPASATSTSASCGTGRARPRSRRWAPRGSRSTGELCGWTLARAHARSGDRIAIASYLGSGDAFDEAVADVLGGLRRPERARLRRAGRGREDGQDHGRRGPVRPAGPTQRPAARTSVSGRVAPRRQRGRAGPPGAAPRAAGRRSGDG